MNLQEFTSPLPKPWLNIISNSLLSSEVTAGTSVSVRNLSYAALTNGTGAGPFTIDADSMINGIFANDGTLASVINLPSAASIAALFPADVVLPITFEFKVFSRLDPVTVNLGANCTIFFGSGSSYTSPGNGGSTATFLGGSSGFFVYVQ
jgi:hypothetical protein